LSDDDVQAFDHIASSRANLSCNFSQTLATETVLLDTDNQDYLVILTRDIAEFCSTWHALKDGKAFGNTGS
jgi:hypothetical protein